jgi:hypothetical protein
MSSSKRRKSEPKKRRRQPATAAWRAEALRLYLDGWTFAEIATQLGQMKSTVRDGVRAELAEDIADATERINDRRAVKVAQLDAIIRGHLDDARTGDVRAASVVIAAIERQTKLEGLAVAEKLDVTAKMTLSFDAKEALATKLQELVERRALRDQASGSTPEGASE